MPTKQIKLPEDERAAEIILTSGQVYFPGDGTCVVPMETVWRLQKEGLKYELAPRKPKARKWKPREGG